MGKSRVNRDQLVTLPLGSDGIGGGVNEEQRAVLDRTRVQALGNSC